MKRTSTPAGIALLVGSAVCFATSSLFVTWLAQAGVEAWFQIAARLAVIVVVILATTLLFRRDALRLARPRRLHLPIMNGLVMLLGSAAYISAISMGTSPTKAALLVYLSPIYVALLGTRLLGERMTRKKILALAIGLAGIALTLKIWDVHALSQVQLGDLLAASIGFLVAAQVLLGRWMGVQKQTPSLTFVFWSLLLSFGWLLILGLGALAWRGPVALLALLPSSLTPWIAANLLGLSVVGTIAAYVLFYMGLERTEAATAGVILLCEPVTIFVFSYLFLHQPIGWWQIVGGVAVLTAAVLARG